MIFECNAFDGCGRLTTTAFVTAIEALAAAKKGTGVETGTLVHNVHNLNIRAS